MLQIGILSDSHREVQLQKEAIEHLKSEGAQYLLHLGDFEVQENLENLANAKLPYAAVFGNNDRVLTPLAQSYKIAKEPYYLKIKDLKIKMMHHPYYLSSDSDIVLFGHLHKFSVEFKSGTLFLNPGEICARNKNLTECALIKANSNEFIVNYYFKEPKATQWLSREYRFQRI